MVVSVTGFGRQHAVEIQCERWSRRRAVSRASGRRAQRQRLTADDHLYWNVDPPRATNRRGCCSGAGPRRLHHPTVTPQGCRQFHRYRPSRPCPLVTHSCRRRRTRRTSRKRVPTRTNVEADPLARPFTRSSGASHPNLTLSLTCSRRRHASAPRGHGKRRAFCCSFRLRR